jgi:hypothetical protein
VSHFDVLFAFERSPNQIKEGSDAKEGSFLKLRMKEKRGGKGRGREGGR